MSIEAMKQALEALERVKDGHWDEDTVAGRKLFADLRQAIEQAEQAQPVAKRMPKDGDRVICIEDETAGTVQWTSAGGEPYIKFDDGSYGQWSLREFGTLFRYADVTPPQRQSEQAQPVAWVKVKSGSLAGARRGEGMAALPDGDYATYTAPPQRQPWVGLSEEEVKDIVWNLPFEPCQDDILAIEAKLKEKNT